MSNPSPIFECEAEVYISGDPFSNLTEMTGYKHPNM
jgi:hypothetical protein